MKVIVQPLGVSLSTLFQRKLKESFPSRRNYRKAGYEVLLPVIREIVDE